MSEAIVEPRCCFQWEVLSPFLPWRTLETSFFHGTPTICQWRVKFESLNQSLNPLQFSFDLEFNTQWDSRPEVVADKIEISILLDDARIAYENVPNFRFNNDNHFKYNFQGITVVCPHTEPHSLFIEIQIFFPGPRDAEGNGIIFVDEDLDSLSNDLQTLMRDDTYSDLTLAIEGTLHSFRVHTFIIKERWAKLDDIYPPIEHNNVTTSNIDISHDLLEDILTYMYSGKLEIGWPEWTNVAYVTELFQVIDRYRLYHLYKVFVQDDLKQLRVTGTPVLSCSQQYPLVFRNGCLDSISSFPWVTILSDRHTFVFDIILRYHNGIPWLSYCFRSVCASSVNVRLCLEVTRRTGDTFQRVCFLHQRDIYIDPMLTLPSLPFLFPGSPAIFGDSNLHSPGRYYIRCFLRVLDGTTVEQLMSYENDDTMQSDEERYRVLSNHLYQVRMKDLSRDESCVFVSGNGSETSTRTYVHKAIFAGRVPEYWNELEGVNERDGFPDTVYCDRLVRAVQIIITYIYTGKLPRIAGNVLDHIRTFALETNFTALRDSIDRSH